MTASRAALLERYGIIADVDFDNLPPPELCPDRRAYVFDRRVPPSRSTERCDAAHIPYYRPSFIAVCYPPPGMSDEHKLMKEKGPG